MSINELIQTTLGKVNIPVFWQKEVLPSGSQSLDRYVVWFESLQQGELFGNDTELETGHYIQVSVYSTSNYSALCKSLKNEMKLAGFVLRDERDMPYTRETGYFHKVLRFYINEEVII